MRLNKKDAHFKGLKDNKTDSTKSKAALEREKRGYAYLTTRTLVSKARAAGRNAAQEALATMGYLIIAKDGWLVCVNKDGTEERIKPIGHSSMPRL